MCMASGGFFGLGLGQGWMKNNFAAESDIVIATIGEEWGLLAFIKAADTRQNASFAVRLFKGKAGAKDE